MPTWFYWVGGWIVSLALRVIGPCRVEGLERLPRRGAFIVVANHVSDLDPLILGWATGYRTRQIVHFMAKAEVRRWPVIGWLAANAGVFFVRRGEQDRAAQRMALGLLAAGRPLAIFPEGTRSRDARLAPARPGAALLALRSGAPIVPVGISGTERLRPKGAKLIKKARITVRIGEPFQVSHQPKGRLNRDELAATTDRIMRAVAVLIPERMRGVYG